jgi:hypothetical protein
LAKERALSSARFFCPLQQERFRSPVATRNPAADGRTVRIRPGIAIGISAGLLGLAIASRAATTPTQSEWRQTISPVPRGDFPNPRSLIATYRFGWSGLVAATAEVRFAKFRDKLQIIGSGQTIGIVRGLWKFNTYHRATADPTTLEPISTHQVDEFRSKTVTTDLTFRPGKVERLRTDTKSTKPPTTKTFRFANGIYDLHSALLILRSQPLQQGDVYRLIVYPATNAYLTTLTVTDRSPITTAAGTYPAIKLDLELKKIGKHDELEPHKKFRRASVWVSDDSDRLLLRIEASIFVGTIYSELQSVTFP